jgi:positive phototaxis protein PixI
MSDISDIPVSDFQSRPKRTPEFTSDTAPDHREQFLRLHLPDTTALLSVHQLTEVLTIPSTQIVPMPHMPAWIMGIYNWRGEILWMVDLGHLCGFIPWYQQPIRTSVHAVAVLQVRDPSSLSTKHDRLGLVVNAVEDIEWCDPAAIQPLPSTITSELAQFLRGYWWKTDDDMLAILDGAAIIQAMPGHQR